MKSTKTSLKMQDESVDTNDSCNVMQKREIFQASVREKSVFQKQERETTEAKTKFSCSHESTSQRTGSVTKRIHEEHSARKEMNSVVHYSSFAKKLIPREKPKVTLRNRWVCTSSNFLREPRGTESKLQIWTLTQFQQRGAVDQTRMRTVFFI